MQPNLDMHTGTKTNGHIRLWGSSITPNMHGNTLGIIFVFIFTSHIGGVKVDALPRDNIHLHIQNLMHRIIALSCEASR